MGEKINVRIFEGASWVCAADWNKLLTNINDLRTSLALALEPVRSWYGIVERPSLDVIVDVVATLQKDKVELIKLREEVQQLEAELKPPSRSVCEAFVKKLKAFLAVGDAMDQTEGLESHPLVKPLQEACSVIEKLSKAELRRVAELHTVYSLKTTLQHSLNGTRTQIVKLNEWCEKRFSVSIPDLLKKEDWPDTICEVVIRVVEEAW